MFCYLKKNFLNVDNLKENQNLMLLLIKNYCKNDRNFSSTLPMTFRLNKTE